MNCTFANNALFQGVSPEEYAKIEPYIETISVAAEETVFGEGDPGNWLYLVGSGCIRISKLGRGGKQETLSHVQAGNFFGEMSLIDSQPRSAQAQAVEPSVLGKLDRANFDRVLAIAPSEIPMNFIRDSVGRLRNANTHFIKEMMRSERLSLVGTMAGSIIHDFKNPMSAIAAACEFLEKKATDPLTKQLSEIIQRSVQRMLTMTQELLDFSRGTAHLNLERVPIEKLMKELDEQALSQFASYGITVVQDLQYNASVTVDFSRFSRLLLNIVKNAREAMAQGGTFTFGVYEVGDRIVFTIQDSGCGMPPEILQSLFEPFVTHGKANGTGLGMAIAKSVVDAHKGTIQVESTQGVGTRFEVSIPAA